MEEVLVPSVRALHQATQTVYMLGYACPREQEHGKSVECENGCGQAVPNPKYHYSYTPGLLGSGRWSCFSKRRVDEEAERLGFELSRPRSFSPGVPHCSLAHDETRGLGPGSWVCKCGREFVTSK